MIIDQQHRLPSSDFFIDLGPTLDAPMGMMSTRVNEYDYIECMCVTFLMRRYPPKKTTFTLKKRSRPKRNSQLMNFIKQWLKGQSLSTRNHLIFQFVIDELYI
jgi:hypothetical protein